MTTPWERELAEKKRREEEAHIAIPIAPSTATLMASRPKLVFFASILAMIIASVIMFFAYDMYRESLGLGEEVRTGRRRRSSYDHPSQALLIFVPFLLFATALGVRFLLMKDIAREISKKIARKTKCRPEFEQVIFKLILGTPWSKYRFRWYQKGRRVPKSFQRVTTKFGESRTVEFADDLSVIVVGPEQWVDPKDDSVLGMMLDGKDPFRPQV